MGQILQQHGLGVGQDMPGASPRYFEQQMSHYKLFDVKGEYLSKTLAN